MNSDPRAEIGAAQQLANRLVETAKNLDGGFGDAWCDNCDQPAEVDELTYEDALRVAQLLVAGFTVRYERVGGNRRPVLVGAWEVDPLAVRQPAAAGAT